MEDRYVDLLRQGIWKGPRREKVKAAKPIVTCDECRDWHRAGKHTKTRAERKALKVLRETSEK